MRTNESLVWLITGCSSGLGRALVQRALQAGDRVVATARDVARIQELATENCRTTPLDVTHREQVRQVIAFAGEAFGQIDVLVNNAGYGLAGALEEVSEEQIARNFDTNLFGALHLMRAALPMMRAQGHGHIVNVSAAAAISNYPGFSIYGASKCALEAVSESLAQELAPLGIRVTVVEPGPFRTDFLGRSLEQAENPMPEYSASSGRFIRTLKGLNGKQAGDPERAATAIMQAVRAPKPPFRLVLGRYAVDKTRKKMRATEAELELWQEISSATDYQAAAIAPAVAASA